MRERGRGVIVNMGSGVSTLLPSSPLLSVYAGEPLTMMTLSCWRMCSERGARCRSTIGATPHHPATLTHPVVAGGAGSKAYVDCFSRSLDAELACFGIRVQNQAPLFVATKMSKIRCAGRWRRVVTGVGAATCAAMRLSFTDYLAAS